MLIALPLLGTFQPALDPSRDLRKPRRPAKIAGLSPWLCRLLRSKLKNKWKALARFYKFLCQQLHFILLLLQNLGRTLMGILGIILPGITYIQNSIPRPASHKPIYRSDIGPRLYITWDPNWPHGLLPCRMSTARP